MFSEFSTAKNRTASHKLRDPSNSGLNSGWISNENRVPRYTDTNKEHLVVDARGWRAKRLRGIFDIIYIYIYIYRKFDISMYRIFGCDIQDCNENTKYLTHTFRPIQGANESQPPGGHQDG